MKKQPFMKDRHIEFLEFVWEQGKFSKDKVSYAIHIMLPKELSLSQAKELK